jgi:rod shape determining protein RodA
MSVSAHDFDILDNRIGVFNFRNVRRVDRMLTVLVIVLAFIGIMCLYSASGVGASKEDYYLRQMLNLFVGTVVAVLIVCIDYRYLVSIAPLLYTGSFFLLVLVTIIGHTAKGGQRWIDFGFRAIQPSELAKVALVYALAWYLSLIKDRIRKFHYLVLAFIIGGVPAFLILVQPSLSTAMTLGPISLAMIYAAGCKRWHLVVLFLIGVSLAPVAYYTVFTPYQRARVDTYLSKSPSKEEVMDKSWQPIQARITVGSGKTYGKGFERGTQTHLRYLPDHHTDFIFALVAEEMGFVGGVFVITMFGLLLLRSLELARRCPEFSGALLGVGATAVLAVHVIINIGITIGLLPVTGLPLPFLSHGGSFYLTTMMCIGTLLNLNIRRDLFGPGS